MTLLPTRRDLLAALPLAGAAGLLRIPQAWAGAERIETTSLRLMKSPSICIAPEDVADELLRAEGFTDIRHLPLPSQSFQEKLADGELDIGLQYASEYVEAIDRGLAVTVLAGAHVGASSCSETQVLEASSTSKAKRSESRGSDRRTIYSSF